MVIVQVGYQNGSIWSITVSTLSPPSFTILSLSPPPPHLALILPPLCTPYLSCTHPLSSVFRVLMLPVISCVLWFAPHSKLASRWTSPVEQFLNHNSSYIMFLVVLFLHSDNKRIHYIPGKKIESTRKQIHYCYYSW